jgi:hypothetical protein
VEINKKEQVKKILGEFIYRFRLTQTDTERENNENKAIKALETLYSEPQVCPKPQLVICPKAKECIRCHFHSKQHIHTEECNIFCEYGNCICIPVPSTPARPKPVIIGLGELEELDGICRAQYLERNPPSSTPASAPLPPELLTKTEMEKALNDTDYGSSYFTSIAKAQQLKCHQSEAAIRADQNKKIGDKLSKYPRQQSFNGNTIYLGTKESTGGVIALGSIDYLIPEADIAKLQKGESQEAHS